MDPSSMIIIAMEGTALLFLLVLLLEAFIYLRHPEIKTRLCRLCLILTIVALAVEILSYAIDGNTSLIGLGFAANVLTFLFGSWIIAAFSYYVVSLMRETSTVSYWFVHPIMFLVVLGTVDVVVNSFNGNLFTYYDAVYEEGPKMAWFSGFQMLFIVYLMIFVLISRKRLSLHDWLVLLVYVSITILTTLLEMAFVDMPSFYFVGQALAMDFVYVEERKRLRTDLENIKELNARIEQQNVQLDAQQAALESALVDAQAASRAKSSFLFNMSHDIRTPMNAVLGYLDRARRHIDDKEIVTDSLAKVETAGQYLLSLVNEVLDVARIEANAMSLDEEAFDLVKGADGLAEIFRTDAMDKHVLLECDFSQITDRYVWQDRLRLSQILSNILTNAIKYTHEGGRVDFNISQVGPAVDGRAQYAMTVTDTGIGMSEEFVEHVFDQFSRAETDDTSGIQGTGLGMSIVKRLVELMGGTVTVKSALGKGTEVKVLLSLRTATEEERAASIAICEPQLPSNTDYSGKRILLVEDNELNREIAQTLLEEYGVTVDNALDGVQAVEKMKASAPGYYGLVLMDIQMPRMNGYEASRAIRALPDRALASVPIVAMTANAFEEDRRDAFDAGMNDHIAKPINVSRLLEVLTLYLGVTPTLFPED